MNPQNMQIVSLRRLFCGMAATAIMGLIPSLCWTQAQEQKDGSLTEVIIEGTIIAPDDEPALGATAVFYYSAEKENTMGARADINGYFQLKVPKKKGDCRLTIEDYGWGKKNIIDASDVSQLSGIKEWDVTICSEPVLYSILRQKYQYQKDPEVCYKKYIGKYEITSTDSMRTIIEGEITLRDEEFCNQPRRSRNSCSWSIQNECDVKIQQGRYECRSEYVLWEKNNKLVGYKVEGCESSHCQDRFREVTLRRLEEWPLKPADFTSLIVKIVDGTKHSVGECYLEIRKNVDDPDPVASGETDANGKFIYPCFPKMDNIFIRVCAPYPFSAKEVKAGLTRETITVTLEKMPTLAEICNVSPSPTAATLCVRAVSPKCLPINGARFELMDKNGGNVRTKQADQNGVAVFTDLPPGVACTVRAFRPGSPGIVKGSPVLKAGCVEYLEITMRQ